jgi:hypothetical protein
MVYNIQNYWGLGLDPSSGIVEIRKNRTFRKLNLFPFLGEGGDTYSVGSLRKT